MRKVCRAVFCAVVILLLGIFSQQRAKAGETNERRYSRAYSVLSANVGNSEPIVGYPLSYKLAPGSEQERRVVVGIKLLKPDIIVLIEAWDKDQAIRICNEGKPDGPYSVHGGPYDFICIKNDIGDVIKDEQMPGGNGNSVGYVDVSLKDENSRKVRLFYAHFPSPQFKWVLGLGWALGFGEAEHKAHVSSFGWIEAMLIRAASSDIPCLIAGDLNNDFIRQRDGKGFWSGKYIYDQVNKLNLRIFNPPTDQLMFQLPDGSTKSEYEATYRPPQTVGWETTIDWVMGKNVVPPPRVPGWHWEIDPITGTIPNSFVTSPPDWWKDTGIGDISRLRFDHKPLYGKVVFFWEEPVQPLVKDWKEYKLGALVFSLPADWTVLDMPTAAKLASQHQYLDPDDHAKIAKSEGYCGYSVEDYFSKKHINFSAVVAEAKDTESGTTRIVYYGMNGGKEIVQPGTTSRTISLGYPGYLVDGIETKIAGLPVTVCVFHLTEKEGLLPKGFYPEGTKIPKMNFSLFRDGKHYYFDLTGVDTNYLKAICKEIIERIRLSPGKD